MKSNRMTSTFLFNTRLVADKFRTMSSEGREQFILEVLIFHCTERRIYDYYSK